MAEGAPVVYCILKAQFRHNVCGTILVKNIESMCAKIAFKCQKVKCAFFSENPFTK